MSRITEEARRQHIKDHTDISITNISDLASELQAAAAALLKVDEYFQIDVMTTELTDKDLAVLDDTQLVHMKSAYSYLTETLKTLETIPTHILHYGYKYSKGYLMQGVGFIKGFYQYEIRDNIILELESRGQRDREKFISMLQNEEWKGTIGNYHILSVDDKLYSDSTKIKGFEKQYPGPYTYYLHIVAPINTLEPYELLEVANKFYS